MCKYKSKIFGFFPDVEIIVLHVILFVVITVKRDTLITCLTLYFQGKWSTDNQDNNKVRFQLDKSILQQQIHSRYI